MTVATLPNLDRHREDRELAARCASSPPSREAWNDLYGNYGPAVRAWLRRGWRAGGDDSTEDLMQQVFVLCAGGALARYRGEVSLRSYLFTLADRVRISENRRLTRQRRDIRKQVSLTPDSDEEPDPEASLSPTDSLPHALGLWSSQWTVRPDSRVETNSEEARIQRVLSKVLDPKDREIIESHYWRGESDRSVGERLQMPTNTITWRRHRALAALRRTMKREAFAAPQPLDRTTRETS